jgi:hypothetical protein
MALDARRSTARSGVRTTRFFEAAFEPGRITSAKAFSSII